MRRNDCFSTTSVGVSAQMFMLRLAILPIFGLSFSQNLNFLLEQQIKLVLNSCPWTRKQKNGLTEKDRAKSSSLEKFMAEFNKDLSIIHQNNICNVLRPI